MIGLGLTEFKKDGFNILDLFTVIMSGTQIVLLYSGSTNKNLLSILKAIRALRILKICKIGELKLLLDSSLFTISSTWSYYLLVSFFMYIFALVGMSSFAGKLKFNDKDELDLIEGESPRPNFDKLSNSLIAICEIFIGGGWSNIMYQCIRANGKASSIYFILLVVMGTIILMNLFLAILLGNFEKAR